MTESPSPYLPGQQTRFSVSVIRTHTPWSTDIDAIVLSVGSGLGELGRAVQENFSGAEWHRIRFEEITPAQPALLELPAARASELRFAVLATPHDGGFEGPVTLEAVGRATEAAIHKAAGAGATAVGMPLLATGVLGLPPDDVANVVVPAALTAHVQLRRSPLREVVFLCQDRETEAAIRSALEPPRPWDQGGRPQSSVDDIAGVDGDTVDGGAHTPVPPRYSAVDLAGGVSTDRVDPKVGIPLSRDQLGVAPYVSMLATVIADRRTPLPLSVGIFGEWGSGKSYFMGMLRQQVEDLAGSNAEYCGEIVQIGFNAWHYADSNLWASLGDEIFRQLAGPGPSDEERRERLRAELGRRLEQLRELKTTTQQAQSTAAALQADVDAAIASRTSTARDLITALKRSGPLKERLDGLWRSLGIDDAVEQGNLLAEQLHGTLTEAKALHHSPRDRRGRFALVLSAAILLGVAVVAAIAPEVRNWLAGVGAVFTAVAGFGLVALGRARAGVRALRVLSEDLRTGLDSAARDRATPEVRGLLEALRKAEADQRVAEAQLSEVVSQVGELGRQLTELTPGQHLYAFLADRAQGNSYRRNLGLISTIRKDFEQLVALMADWRTHGEQDGSAPKPIDRIVLYIDDLDRCSSSQVVDVLQAVHLLLALDLFVVVVGVDPRWLLRSLGTHYEPIFTEGRADSEYTATPEDYLEKIINIPLALPGMSSGHLHQLLSSIANDTMPTVVADGSDTPNTEPAQQTALDQPDPINIEHGSEVDSQLDTTRPIEIPHPLTEHELTLLAKLDLLISTPREAKRLFNLYRMLRATRDLSEASQFLGSDERPGEYQAVAVLLGLLTAEARLLRKALDTRPDLNRNISGGLVHRSPDDRWEHFVADFEPQTVGEKLTNRLVGTLPDGDVQNWRRLHRGLTHVSSAVTLTDLSRFQAWAPVLRRFAYIPLNQHHGLPN